MSEKQASQVLTGENAAEFYANRLGLAESPAAPVAEEPSEPEVVVEEQSEPEEAEAEAKQEGERKQNPKLERRFSEITKQREEARKEAQREREQREALEQRLAALESQRQPQRVAEAVDQEPQPSQFSDAFEYAKALAEFTADKRIADMKREEAAAKEAEERQKVIQTWAKKVETAKATLPDFDDIVASSDVVVNDDIRDAILESDVGPQILYHLAENDEVARKIAGLSPKAALREIGKLEARFEAKPEAEKTAPVVKSKAPAPIQPIRGGKNIPDVPMGSDGVFYGTAAQWKELRKAGKIR
jgi:hypothetical protein